MIVEAAHGANVVIVTGAGSNIGRAIALRMLRDGFVCVLAGLDEGELAQTAALANETHARAIIVACDIRRERDRVRLFDAATSAGALFALVNNAGVFRSKPLLEETLDDWRDVQETNLEASFFLSQRAVELLRPRGRGRIVNIASMHGVVGVNNLGRGALLAADSIGDRGPMRCSAYAAMKGGLIQMTRDLAVAVGPWGITVNAVSPGSVPPEQLSAAAAQRLAALSEDERQSMLAALADQVPLRRLASPAEIAGPVSFFLSEDSAYVTGVNLLVDGGFTAW